MSAIPRADPAGTRLALLAAAVTVVLWTSTFVGVRSFGTSFSPGYLALGRLLIGAVVLTGVALSRGAVLPRGRVWWLIIGYGVLWFVGYNVALNAAERHLDAGNRRPRGQRRPDHRGRPGRALLVRGVPPLVGHRLRHRVRRCRRDHHRGAQHPADRSGGVAFCLAAAVLYAGGVVAQKMALATVRPLTATWLGCLVGAVVCLPYAGTLIGGARPGVPRWFSDRRGLHHLGSGWSRGQLPPRRGRDAAYYPVDRR